LNVDMQPLDQDLGPLGARSAEKDMYRKFRYISMIPLTNPEN
jgi:hypothetical protein